MSNILVELSNSMAAATEKAAASTLLVNARRRMPASGIAFAPDLVLTADHVVEQEDGITILLPDGTQAAAKLAGRDPGSDLAVIRLEGKERLTPAQPAKEARVGQLVLALGRPTDAGIEASLGVVSAMGGPLRTPNGSIDKYIRTDATPYPGFSGGPLVDAEGQVVGVNTSGFGRGECSPSRPNMPGWWPSSSPAPVRSSVATWACAARRSSFRKVPRRTLIANRLPACCWSALNTRARPKPVN